MMKVIDFHAHIFNDKIAHLAIENLEKHYKMPWHGKGTFEDMREQFNKSGFYKAVIFSIVKEDKVKEILATYEDKYFKTKRGKGVAFTIPISSVIGVMVYKFLLNVNEG